MSGWIRDAWIAFAARGDPGWPAFDARQLLDTRPAVTAYPEEASRLLWQEHRFHALALTDQ